MANPKAFIKAYKKKVQKDITEKIKYKVYGHHYDPSKANLDFPNAKPLALKLYKCLNRFEIYGEPAVLISKEIAAILDKLNIPKNEKDTIISIGISVSAGETLKEKFNRIDINNNEFISLDEMVGLFLPSKTEKIILKTCGLSFHKNWKILGYLSKLALKVADLYKDSFLDFNEFLVIIKSPRPDKPNNVFIHSDIDIQFFGNFIKDCSNEFAKQNYDILFQIGGRSICMGFFICRANEKTKKFFTDI